MTTTNKVYKYSSDGEVYNFDDVHDAILDITECLEGPLTGQVVIISRGEEDCITASTYAPNNILDYMSDNAYEECGEWGEDWPKVTKEAELELDAMVKAAVDSWADKHDCQPTFYKAVDTYVVSTHPVAINDTEEK